MRVSENPSVESKVYLYCQIIAGGGVHEEFEGFRPLAALAMALLYAGLVSATNKVWNDHAWPYTFLFGNHIDTHQETYLWKTGFLREAGIDKGDLTGFFLCIRFWRNA